MTTFKNINDWANVYRFTQLCRGIMTGKDDFFSKVAFKIILQFKKISIHVLGCSLLGEWIIYSGNVQEILYSGKYLYISPKNSLRSGQEENQTTNLQK